MGWREDLQPASFRGVPFHIEGDDMAGGRRSILHEYPQRDEPFVEDNGRSARTIAFGAFVIGDDFMAKRDALLAALEAYGSGQLVHPFYGSLTVNAGEYRVTHNKREGGAAWFQLQFIESGELTFPTGEVSTSAEVREAADQAEDAEEEEFAEEFSVEDEPDFVAEAAQENATSVLGDFKEGLATVNAEASAALAAIKNPQALLALLVDPAALASQVREAFAEFTTPEFLAELQGLRADGSGLLDSARSLIDLAGGLEDPAAPPAGVYATAGQTQNYRNTAALNGLMRVNALATAADLLSAAPLPIYDDALAARRDLTAALDVAAGTASDALFGPLTDLRVAVHADVTARARDSARIQSIQPAEIVPAVVIAYDLYEDAKRGEEIVLRNAIPHPGFVGASAIRVLSR